MIKIQKFFNRRLRTLIFFVTTKCPLKCKHCFYSNELNKKTDELTLDEIEKIASNIPDLEYLQLSGGEPFMRKDLIELMDVFHKRGIKKMIIPTNGYFVKQTIDKVKEMKKRNFNFQIMISIDGFKDLHNQIRCKDCFDNAMQTFGELTKLGVNIGFNVALSKMNYDSYIDLIKFLKTKTDDIDPILVRAKPDVMLSAKEFKSITSQIEILTSEKLTSFYKKRRQMLNEIYCNVLDGKPLPYKCLAGEIIAVLEPDGQVKACEMLNNLGNVRDYNYDILEILKKRKIPYRCKDCIRPCFVGPSMSYDLKWLT